MVITHIPDRRWGGHTSNIKKHSRSRMCTLLPINHDNPCLRSLLATPFFKNGIDTYFVISYSCNTGKFPATQ